MSFQFEYPMFESLDDVVNAYSPQEKKYGWILPTKTFNEITQLLLDPPPAKFLQAIRLVWRGGKKDNPISKLDLREARDLVRNIQQILRINGFLDNPDLYK